MPVLFSRLTTLVTARPPFDPLLQLLHINRDHKGALVMLERALVLQPHHVQARFQMANVYISLGKNEVSGDDGRRVTPRRACLSLLVCGFLSIIDRRHWSSCWLCRTGRLVRQQCM